MKHREPPFVGRNLYVLVNIYLQIAPYLVLPLGLLIADWIAVGVVADSYCMPDACTAVPRAGTVVLMTGIVYIYFQEFVIPLPDEMARELRCDPLLIAIHAMPGSERITRLLDKILDVAERL